MREKWKKIFSNQEISEQEILYRLCLASGLVITLLALMIALVAENQRPLAIPILIVMAFLVFLQIMSIRYHKYKAGIFLLTFLLNFAFFPGMFFLSGGIDGGAAIWFVLGFFCSAMLLRGKAKGIMIAATLVDVCVCYYIGFAYPQLISPLGSRQEEFLDSLLGVLAVGFTIALFLTFHIRINIEQKRLSAEQTEEIRQLSNSKNAFFASMSHEIRTPINTIIGLNEMTLREDISDEIAENAMNIQSASKMLLSMINDILDLSKIETGKMEIIPVQYETGTMFSDLVNVTWIRAAEKKLEFKLNISENMPSMLYGDEVRIKQVVTNLLNNAVKYTQKGSITLTAESEKLDANTIRLKVSVTDTGMGIHRENLGDLFEAFKRVDEKKNRAIEGTGLGLAICKQLMDLMGGVITVDSIYTKGSTFTMSLEQKIVNETPVGEISRNIRHRLMNRQKYKQSFEAPEARVLVVDDNEMNLLVAQKLLRDTKVQVDTASSGVECLEKTRKKLYHVIFMDHLMPEMDGVQALQKLRRQEDGLCNHVPVVALTANAMSGAEQIYQDFGFSSYLAKPINGALFEAMLLKFLPQDLIETSNFDSDSAEFGEIFKMVKGRMKKPILITTDCVCDMPKELLKQFHVPYTAYNVYTEEGCFAEETEITADDLLEYSANSDFITYTTSASLDDYEKFFAKGLEEARDIIHITMSKVTSMAYDVATSASKGFDHVHIIDSEGVSCGMGIVVMAAAKMVQEGKNLDEVLAGIQRVKSRVSSTFMVARPDHLYRSGKISKNLRNLCNFLLLHPILALKRGKLTSDGMIIGTLDAARKRYIRRQLKKKKKIDRTILFIAYVGCSIKERDLILYEVNKHVEFDKIIMQKASAAIASNAGNGAFGLFYLTNKK